MKARLWPVILFISLLTAGCGDEAYLEIKNTGREPVLVRKETRGEEGSGSYKIIAGGQTREYMLDTWERDIAINVTALPSSDYLAELHALRGELMLKLEFGANKLTGKEIKETEDRIFALQNRLNALVQAQASARNKCTIWYKTADCGTGDRISGHGYVTVSQKPDGTLEMTCKSPAKTE